MADAVSFKGRIKGVHMRKIEIFCNNKDCCWYKGIPPEKYLPYENFKGFWDIIVSGKCTNPNIYFEKYDFSSNNIKYIRAICYSHNNSKELNFDEIGIFDSVLCERKDCLYNKDLTCSREKIRVEVEKIEDEVIFSCKAFSNKKISGHFDWTRYPIGGNIDDTYAEKLDRDNRATKSYSTHMRQANPRKKPTLPFKPRKFKF